MEGGHTKSPSVSGGQTGIRTLETVTRLHAFQACAFDHSATCPIAARLHNENKAGKGKTALYICEMNIHTAVLFAFILDLTQSH